ncbi:MAG: ABC transporter substrate-binding protein [Nitrospina sp.]|jgi:ABC-type transporter MlaC component|nr:ABC transporter substrate-binding protein [Nitrospina sp.]
MRNSKKIAFTSFLLFFFLTGLSWADTEKSKPEAAVKILLNEIKQIVDADGLSDADILTNKKHSDLAVSILNVPEISEKALGKYWAKHSEEQQNQFQNLLGELFVHVAFPSSAKFFANLDLVYGKTKSKKDMMVVPITVIHEKEGEVDIDFRMKLSEKRWLVVDVILDGISMRNNLRSQFYKILKKKDFDHLVHKMGKKLKEAKS